MNAVPVVLLVLLGQMGTPAADPDAKARAQAILKEGTQLYQQGAFADALEKFEQAYAVFPSPKLFFNIGRASRELGRPVQAVEAFEKFIAQATDASPELLAEAKRSVEELSPKIGKLLIDCTLSGAEITVDGRTVGRTPLADLIRVMPGKHQVTAMHPSATPAIESAVVAAGTVETVVLRPRPLTEPTPPLTAVPPVGSPALDLQAAQAIPESHGWWLGRKWTWVAAGSTVVFAGVAGIAGWSMQSKFDELRKSCGKAAGANWTGCSSSDISSLDARKNTANVFWGLTAAAAVATGVLFYLEGRPVALAPMAGELTGVLASVRY